MILADIAEGQRVYLATSEPGTLTIIPANVNSASPPVLATLLRHVSGTGYSIIGWLKDEPRLSVRYDRDLPDIEDEWKKQGIVYAVRVSNQVLLAAPYTPENAVSSIKEKNCRQCGRMNDVGISSCWWCQISNPTT